MIRIFKHILVFIFIGSTVLSAKAQHCIGNDATLIDVGIISNTVHVYCCVDIKATLGTQACNWGMRNLTSKEVNITFVKKYTMKCGNIILQDGSISLKPNQYKGGANFGGDDLALNDMFDKEDCAGESKIASIGINNYEITFPEDIEKAKQEEEAKQRAKEERERADREAREAREEEQRQAQQKAADEREQAERDAQYKADKQAQQQAADAKAKADRDAAEAEEKQKAWDIVNQTNQHLKQQNEDWMNSNIAYSKSQLQEQKSKNANKLNELEEEEGEYYEKEAKEKQAKAEYQQEMQAKNREKQGDYSYYRNSSGPAEVNAYIKLNSKDYSGAIGDYKNVVYSSPYNCEAYNNLGYCYEQLNDLNNAVSNYQKAIECNKGYTVAFNNLFNLLMKRATVSAKKGLYDSALSDLKDACTMQPKNADAFVNLGWIYNKLGNESMATDCYKLAAQLGNKSAQQWLRFRSLTW